MNKIRKSTNYNYQEEKETNTFQILYPDLT